MQHLQLISVRSVLYVIMNPTWKWSGGDRCIDSFAIRKAKQPLTPVLQITLAMPTTPEQLSSHTTATHAIYYFLHPQ